MILLLIQLTMVLLKAFNLTEASWLAILSPAWIVGVSLTVGLVIARIMAPEERRV